MCFRFFYLTFLLLLSFVELPILGARVIAGDLNSSSGRSFTFALGPSAIYRNSLNQFTFFVASGQEKKDNDYAIAKIDREKLKFDALTPKKVTLNNNPAQDNPLNGSKISLLQLVQGLPVAVKEGDNKKIFLINVNNFETVSSADLMDADVKVTSGIIQLKTINSGSKAAALILAAVKNNNGDSFGAQGSGIAILRVNEKKIKVKKEVVKNKEEQNKEGQKKEIKEKEIKEEEKILNELIVLNADKSHIDLAANKNKDTIKANLTKLLEQQKDKSLNRKDKFLLAAKTKEMLKLEKENEEKEKLRFPANKAAPFDCSTSAIKIGSDVVFASDVIDMHWDEILNRLYIGLQLKSGNFPGSGARAIVVGRIKDNKLYFDEIVSSQIISGNDKIVATGTPDQNIAIYKVRTMHTSTLLNYLVVAGGNDAISNVGNKIYALPLVNRRNENQKNISEDIIHGTLAKFDQDPKDIFNNGIYFSNRAFAKQATSAADLLTCNDEAAIVGRGNLPLKTNQKITDIFISGDAVFATIANDYEDGVEPGIFYSQAIFDNKGRIQNWTKWSRIAGTDDKVFAAGIDYPLTWFWYISGDAFGDTIKVTKWGKGENVIKGALNKGDGALGGTESNQDVGLVSILDKAFPQSTGGIQSLFDFSKNISGFDNFSMMIAGGLKKVILIEAGSEQSGIFKPCKGDFSNKITTFTGEALDSIHSIVAAEIASAKDQDKHWIIVGGSGGLAVLCDENGEGWQGNIKSLNDISQKLSFKKIGKYSFVKKLQSDGNFLYVLTDKKLDKIVLSSESFKTGNLNIKTLADSSFIKSSYASFYDFGVCDKFALLATSSGLFRVGNNKDIRIANNSSEINWTNVKIPEVSGPASGLYFITGSGHVSDFAKKGQVYVLSSNKGLQQSCINRFFVNLNLEVDDSTITPINDLYIKNTLSTLFDFGEFKSYFSYAGSLLFYPEFKQTKDQGSIEKNGKIISGIRSGSRLISTMTFNVPVQLGNNIFISSALGSLITSGTFGLHVNE